MEQRDYTRLGETVFHTVLSNGLNIYVDRKKDYQKSFAFFATRYGGMDMKFQLDGKWQDTPAGVAHFLEHKMFDTEDGNALQVLALNGAQPNAFTSNAITGYFFESTEQFEENLKILLSFVSVPWFTQESVDKEQGIIGQEIRMIEDNPEWQVYMQMLSALYQSHPITVPIAGSEASISRITADTLYHCHRAFYRPGNMVLCVAGDVDPARIAALAAEILPQEAGEQALRDYGAQEPEGAVKALVTMEMEVAAPLFQIGFKADAPVKGEGALRQQLVCSLACDALAGTSSPLYARMYEEGIINATFGYDYEEEPGCAFFVFGGESDAPERVREAVLAEAERIAREGIDDALWGRLKKAAYGQQVRRLNSFESICVQMAQAHFDGYDYLRFPQVFDTIGKSDAEQVITRIITRARAGMAVILPKEGADGCM